MDPQVTCEQYFAAVERGDARTIAAFLTQRAQTGQSRSSRDDDQHDDLERRPGDEWLGALDIDNQYEQSNSLVEIAIDRDYGDVLEWLFSVDAMSVLEEEPLIVALCAACHFTMRARALGLLEIVLASPVFTRLLPDEQRELVLGELLGMASDITSPEVVSLLTAHGANINLQSESLVLTRAAGAGNDVLVGAAFREGAFIVGDIRIPGSGLHHANAIERLLIQGCRVQDAADLFDRAVAYGLAETAEILLKHEAIDVDMRNCYGETPLMRVASSSMKPAPGLTSLLFKFGADVAARDDSGQTPLVHAICCYDVERVRLLLEHGADPNQPTEGQRIALDYIDFGDRRRRGPRLVADVIAAPRQLECLLEYGANPFAPGLKGLSTVDRLQQTLEGKAFISSHPEWFAARR